ncbi:MFS transporter [Streptomyces cinerochromogenes]|uniref:MFS transporter n=1 Tax=Streptomyces cinerochromogenes TaxID=66422 RepID=A0ABW7B9I8_9ACTN
MTPASTARDAAAPSEAAVPLRTTRSFRAYRAGEAVTLAGTSVHGVALPVVAVLELDASPGQVPLLAAAATAPAFVLALPAGVAGDRYPKKRIMVGTDLAAAAVVSVVPGCWAAGLLSVPVLYAVTLLSGALTVLHQAASIAIVPEIVDRSQARPANARIAGAFSRADTAGTYGGTLVVGLVGAVRALWLDAASYVVSAWCASRIRPSAVRREAADRPRMLAAIREGVGYVMRDPIQRPLVLSLAGHAYADGIVTTHFAYTLLTRLDSGSTGLGLVMGVTAAGGLAGAVVATRLVDRHGPARVLSAGFLAYTVCGVPLLVARPGPVWLGVIALAGAVRTAAAVAAGTTQRSIRQQLCPPELQSRAQQTSVWLVTGLRPAAALTAGGIAASFSVHSALLVGTALCLVPASLLWSSPLRRLTVMPALPLAKDGPHAS